MSVTRRFTTHFLPAVALLFSASVAAVDDEFIGRPLFPTVKWISLTDLAARRADMEVVDVRSRYEFETLHIKDAHHIPLGEENFDAAVKQLRNASSRPIVFYCNGRSCMKSYEATLSASNAGLDNVFAYDAGVLDWVKAYPEHSVLLGQSPVDLGRLIGKETLSAHMLSPQEFDRRVSDNTIVLDVRDAFQTEATTLFPAVQHSVPLDNAALKRYVEQAKKQRKTLLIYDAAGHQVRWLQYFLQAEQVPSYYFMQGGAKAYYDMMLGDLMATKK